MHKHCWPFVKLRCKERHVDPSVVGGAHTRTLACMPADAPSGWLSRRTGLPPSLRACKAALRRPQQRCRVCCTIGILASLSSAKKCAPFQHDGLPTAETLSLPRLPPAFVSRFLNFGGSCPLFSSGKVWGRHCLPLECPC
jgi:hypothetical protein